MVLQETIPLSGFNNITGLVGVRFKDIHIVAFQARGVISIDVYIGEDHVGVDLPDLTGIEDTIDRIVPDVEDIGETVDAVTVDLESIGFAIDSAVEQAEDTITAEIQKQFGFVEDEVGNIDIPTVDEIFDPIDDAIEDVRQDIDQLVGDVDAALDEEFDDVASGIQGAVDEISAVQEAVDDALSTLEGLNDVSVDQVNESAQDALTAVLEDLEILAFLEDPLGWLEENLLDVTPEMADRLEQDLERLEDKYT